MYQFKNLKVYLLLLLVFIVCFFIRQQQLSMPGLFIDHISNFAITGALFLLSSDTLLLRKNFTKKKLLLELAPFAMLNIIVELFIRADTVKIGIVKFVNFNTPDVLDLIYGLLALVLIYFVIIRYAIDAKPIKK